MRAINDITSGLAPAPGTPTIAAIVEAGLRWHIPIENGGDRGADSGRSQIDVAVTSLINRTRVHPNL